MKRVLATKRKFFFAALASLWIAVAAATLTGQEVEFTGEVTRVIDGDTVIVLDDEKLQRRVRLVAIDAPEKGQDFSVESKKSLSTLVYGKRITVTTKKTDRYGRIIGKILIDGVDVSLEQIRLGLAWHFKEYAKEQSAGDRETYAEAELATHERKN